MIRAIPVRLIARAGRTRSGVILRGPADRARTLVAVHQDPTDQPPTPEPGEPGQRPAEQRQLAPLDLPMVPFVVGGLIVWLIISVILAPLHTTLAEHGRGEWLRISVTGFLVGLPGLALMVVHDRNRRRRRAATNS